jgi:hypothetical protein
MPGSSAAPVAFVALPAKQIHRDARGGHGGIRQELAAGIVGSMRSEQACSRDYNSRDEEDETGE